MARTTTGDRTTHHRTEPGLATGVWSLVVCVVGLAVVGAIGIALHQPWVFPSLGPTLMVLAETPDQPAALPRNVLVGHLVGIAAGVLALVVTGLLHHPSALQEGLTTTRVLATCLSLGLTALVLQVLRTPHPPAGATTLIVSLGLLRTGEQLLVVLLAVVVCLAVALALRTIPAPARHRAP